MFLGLIYVQLVAVLVALRPRLHAAWGYLLIGFHLGTWVLMEIVFVTHILFLLLLFVLSPFRPARVDLRGALGDVPLFGRLFVLAWPRPVEAGVGNGRLRRPA